jgi:hypothetical protein
MRAVRCLPSSWTNTRELSTRLVNQLRFGHVVARHMLNTAVGNEIAVDAILSLKQAMEWRVATLIPCQPGAPAYCLIGLGAIQKKDSAWHNCAGVLAYST